MDDKTLDEESRVALLDNGSLSPDSVLQARELASELSKRIGCPVDSVSVSHVDRVALESIDGCPGIIWKAYLDKLQDSELRDLVALPLFFGPSYGLRKAQQLSASGIGDDSRLRIRWADCLISIDCDRLPEIVKELVTRILDTDSVGPRLAQAMELPSVLVVDHGSPYREVAEYRDFLAEALADRLGGRVGSVIPCSMERREGERYDFNEPLLETALDRAPKSESEALILCQLFLFPGRHAGPEGDIERICRESQWVQNGGRIIKTPLLGSNADLIDLLVARWKAVGSVSSQFGLAKRICDPSVASTREMPMGSS